MFFNKIIIQHFITLIFVTNVYSNNQTSPFLNEHLKNLYSEYNNFNVIIPKLTEYQRFHNKQLNLPWQDFNTPFWLKMANQAMLLDYENFKNSKILLMKLDLSKKLPYLKKLTNICLSNPWSNIDTCSLKKITKNTEFLCLIDNSSPQFVEKNSIFKLFKYSSDNSNDQISSDYKVFCWIIYGINFLEQCQLKLMIDETQCSLDNIQLIINLILIKVNSTEQINRIYTNNLKIIYKHYSNLFIEKSLQILTQLLILFKNNSNHYNLNEDNLVVTKYNLDKLFTFMLDFYVKEKIKNLPTYYLLDDYEKYKQFSFLLTEKLKDLNDVSNKLILNRVANLVENLKSNKI